MRTTATTVAPRRMMLLVAGFIIWSAAFVALYGVNAIGCAFGWPELLQRGILIGLFAIHAAILAWLSVWTWRRFKSTSAHADKPAQLIEYVGAGVSITAFASTLFVLAPSFVLTMCI
jgi:hypothetical protein